MLDTHDISSVISPGTILHTRLISDVYLSIRSGSQKLGRRISGQSGWIVMKRLRASTCFEVESEKSVHIDTVVRRVRCCLDRVSHTLSKVFGS
jgi:hypothetical protein